MGSMKPSGHPSPETLLRQYHVETTRARARILECVRVLSCPFSARDIHESLRRGEVDLATVYRTLHLFEHHGLVHVVGVRGTERLYAGKITANPGHGHFRCVACGRTACLRELDAETNQALRSLVEERGEIMEISVTVSGICANCQDSNTSRECPA